MSVTSTKPASQAWDGKTPLVQGSQRPGKAGINAGLDEFRRVFPLYLCFPVVIPTDEVVSLKMYHREDEPLLRLFLNEPEAAVLNRLWEKHQFVSRQYVLEEDHLPQFMAYVTQDQPKAMYDYFVGQKPVFKARAESLLKQEEAARPVQRQAMFAFAEMAYRRPLLPGQQKVLAELYQKLLEQKVSHPEAMKALLVRILIAPHFLYRLEAPGTEGLAPRAIDDYELATRLSYFLWSSTPDRELIELAKAGKLKQPEVMRAQVARLLADPKSRNFAIEFGTQWLHVRGFDQLKEKNEKLFPMFDEQLRQAMNEEGIQFFLDLFQQNRPVTDLLDSDYVFVNERLAAHYGIPGIKGTEFRRVPGAKKYHRGGIIGFGSVQTKEAGASRTSPVLRGNWIVETLLGEKLPKPPANVPKLPEEEGGKELTMRQQVERHTSEASCASCHQRIDPYGFALEHYDPIGRYRDKEVGGLAVDAKAKLKDGSEFDGIEGLRQYLLAKKKDIIIRLFCKRLLGYALGRSTTLSDTALIEAMVEALQKNGGKVQAALDTIIASPQFLQIRSKNFVE